MNSGQSIYWKETMQVNALRLIGAAIVWFVVAILLGETEAAQSMIALPLFYLILAPIVLVLRNLAPGNAIVGFLGLMAMITVLPGDPVVFLLKLVAPKIVPMQTYYPINPAYFLYVTGS
jgi:hypothetical protein